MFFLAKYNTQTTFYFAMVKRGVVDLAASADWTPVTGDTKISKDGGSFANTTNNPAAVAGTGSIGWSLTLTAAELSAAVINVQIVDSATKAVEDQYITIYTYGNASAKIVPDWSDSVRMGLTALPNAAAEAPGGLFTRGANAGQINQPANGRIDASVAAYGTGLSPMLPIRSATAQGGGANSITLDASASATDGLYDPSIILIRSGTGAGQARMITQYTGSSKVAIVDRTWRTNPDNTSVFEIYPVDNLTSVNEGLAQGGGASTITLNALASTTDNIYNGQLIILRGGTGSDQARVVTGYVGSTKVATVGRAWDTAPDNTTTYIMVQTALPKLDTLLRTTDVNSANLDAAISTRMATFTLPSNFSLLGIDGNGRVDVSKWLGATVNALISGRMDSNAQVVGDKTEYSLTQVFPTNFSSLSIDGSGRVDLGKWIGSAPNALISGKIDSLNSIRSATAQNGTSSTITLDASASSTTDFYKDDYVFILSGTGSGQARLVITYNGTSKVASITPNWATSPDNTSVFVIMPGAMADIVAWLAMAPNVLISGRVDSNAQVVADKTGYNLTQTFPTNFASLIIDSNGRVDLSKILGSAVNALISGRIDAQVGGIGENVIGGSSFTANAVSKFRAVASGTTDSGTTTSVTDSARTESPNDYWKGNFILFTSGDVAGQCRLITAFNSSTKIITFTPALTADADLVDYEIIPVARVDINSWLGSVVNSLVSGRVDSSIGAVAANSITDAAVASDMDAYHAKIWVVKESTTTDHYAVIFFKNGQPVTSGITSPTIQVIKASDGTDLIASTALTQVGALGIYKKDENTNKMAGGSIYFAKVTASIDGSTRTWLQQIGRDSA
jgi:hypothetical protein